ncbi:MAG: TatD family hydrolase [Desulfobacteraceae bacterium]|nr:TatD family hydrolase [Desulfobacteraceae bacterium]
MRIFESHCHINDKSFNKDLDKVIERANSSGVSHMMIAGVTLDTCKKALEIAKANKNIFISVGIHPHDASECSEETIDQLKKIAENNEVKAWGETGLDFNRMYSPQKDQEKWLLRQIEEASNLDLPLIFHERDTNKRFLEIIRAENIKSGVVHCFSGDRDELFSYLDMGLYIGITGVLTIQKRGEKLRELLKDIPLDKILVETDSPYLTPAPQKNKTNRNEPSFLPVIVEKIADIKKADINEISETIFQNTCSLFKTGK